MKTGWRISDTPLVVVQIPSRHHCGRSDKADAAGLECFPQHGSTSSIFAPSETGDRQLWV